MGYLFMKKEFKEKMINLPFSHKFLTIMISFIIASTSTYLLMFLFWIATYLLNIKFISSLKYFIIIVFTLSFWYIIYMKWKIRAEKHK